ncbi:HLF [Branchiostoma lanceolatum]|uniref:HLF protein n=1 Tax=Branchiostoma lanceolatum TaxID=7740 RepID=A0A8K0EXZ7_BRALA|nr:HLF [Branchiostoma lanceolatum]
MSTGTSARVNIAANLGGMTLKSLLENPSVLKPPPEPNHNAGKDRKQLDWSKDADPTLIASAFLGPNLWNKTIAVDSDDFKDFKLEYMDLDEFLAENGIPVNNEDDQSASLPTTSQAAMQHSPPPTYTTMTPMQPEMAYGQHPTSPTLDLSKRHLRISDVRSMADTERPPCELMPRGEIDVKPLVGSLLPRVEQEPPNIPHDMTRPVIEQDEHEQSSMYVSPSVPHGLSRASTSGGHYRQQLSPTPGISPPPHLTADEVMPKVDISLDPGDLALASIPGAKDNFDPRKRTFTDDELKPQPMMKKSKKVYVPTDRKDDRYWQRRQKNNMAAKRSRDARRVKENQIAMRASFLEKENNVLRQELLKVKEENAYLKKKLTKYEP